MLKPGERLHFLRTQWSCLVYTVSTGSPLASPAAAEHLPEGGRDEGAPGAARSLHAQGCPAHTCHHMPVLHLLEVGEHLPPRFAAMFLQCHCSPELGERDEGPRHSAAVAPPGQLGALVPER